MRVSPTPSQPPPGHGCPTLAASVTLRGDHGVAMAAPIPWGLAWHSGGLWPPTPDGSNLLHHNPHSSVSLSSQPKLIRRETIMSAYVILDITVHDPGLFEQYKKLAPETMAAGTLREVAKRKRSKATGHRIAS